MPWRARTERPLLLRRRAGRPQLKRDPLGGITHAKTRYCGRAWAHSRMGSGPCPVPPLVDPCALGSRGPGFGLPSKRAGAVTAGAVYGFVLCFVFTLASYGGAAPAITRIPFFTALGLVGALCGLLLALLGAALVPRTVPVGPPSGDDAA